MESSSAIGRKLSQAREKLALNIEDVSHVTRIPSSVLRALEADDYGTFPSAAYARGFLIQYSDFLGVDTLVTLDAIQDRITLPPAPVLLDLSSASGKSADTSRSSSQWQSLVVIVATSALLYGTVFLYRKFDERLNDARRNTELPVQAAVLVVPRIPANANSSISTTSAANKSVLPEPTSPPRAIIVQEPATHPLVTGRRH